MDKSKPVLNIVVVGFHHKKGCQVEFSYPPLIPGTEGKSECPSGWKYLPTLALPDGSHNFMEDSVFFNLPSLYDPQESIYGVSCYRQIPVEKLKNKTADVTRSTVQKAVCALISTPIYGYIEVKLSLIAQAFFDQGDFSQVDLLVKVYEQLNACLLSVEESSIDIDPMRQYYIGLPLRDLILKWNKKFMILFKLILLQKKIICFGSPVRPICSLILGVVSLFPEIFTKGFNEVACVKTSRPISPMPTFSTPAVILLEEQEVRPLASNIELPADCAHIPESENGQNDEATSQIAGDLPRDNSVDAIASNISALCGLASSDWNAPIQIFHSGNLCLPYLSLPYMDLLSDPSVHGYIIGASNVLFQQKKQLADVLIDVENATMTIDDSDLRRQMTLSSEDLRFIEFIYKSVQHPKEDAEGSENWIRKQFYGYIVALLKTVHTCPDSGKELEQFNLNFVAGLKRTHCYQNWTETRRENKNFDNLPCGHPFVIGSLSMADMKLKIAQTMQNSESGRKLTSAVSRSSIAVGSAITSAKGAFSNFWTTITTTNAQNSEIGEKDTSDKISGKDDLEIPIVMEANEDDDNLKSVKNNIIEIGKEADLLDKKQKVFGI